MGEDECGAGDVADSAGADGDVLEGAPAAFERCDGGGSGPATTWLNDTEGTATWEIYAASAAKGSWRSWGYFSAGVGSWGGGKGDRLVIGERGRST